MKKLILLLLLLCLPIVYAADLNLGNVVRYPLNDSSYTPTGAIKNWASTGNTLNGTGYGNAQLLQPGPTPTSNSTTFDGVDDQINITDAALISITGNISVSTWFKASNFNNAKLVSKRTSAQDSYDLIIYSNQLRFYVDTGTQAFSYINTASLQTNRWYHVTGTYNRSAIILYVDGVPVHTQAQTGSMSDTTKPLTIGGEYDGENLYFNGSLSDVRIYNRTLSSGEILWLSTAYNATLNVTAININTSSSITTFNARLYSASGVLLQTTSTVNGIADLAVNTSTSYIVSFDNSTYTSATASIQINASTTNTYQFMVWPSNSVNITILDETTKNAMSGKNVTLEFISASAAYNYTTNSGGLYVYGLSTETYSIRYSSPGYATRFYYFTLSNRTYNALTIYLLNQTGAAVTNVTATVVDQTGSPLVGAFLKVLRYDQPTNSYITEQILQTNFEGDAIFDALLNQEFYKFIIEYPSGTVVYSTSPTYITQSTIQFQVNLEEGYLNLYNKLLGVSYTLTFDNSTHLYAFDFSDSSNTAEQACMYVYRVTAKTSILTNSSCMDTSSGAIALGVQNVTGATYRADVFITFSGEQQYLSSLTHTYPQADVIGEQALFFVAILSAAVACIGIWNPAIAVSLVLFPFHLANSAGLIQLNWGILISMQILAFIIAYLISDRT